MKHWLKIDLIHWPRTTTRHEYKVAARWLRQVRNKIEKNGYFLTVASNSPHKNFSSVIRAAQKDRIKGLRFIAVGGTFTRIFQAARSVNMPDNIQILGYVNDCELKALYDNAVGLIFPSLYEGFGLPVLEAMQAGCPVLCANSAALMEAGGDAALYFDPLNPDELAGLIDRFPSGLFGFKLLTPDMLAQVIHRGVDRDPV